jgi:hypothetical protein
MVSVLKYAYNTHLSAVFVYLLHTGWLHLNMNSMDCTVQVVPRVVPFATICKINITFFWYTTLYVCYIDAWSNAWRMEAQAEKIYNPLTLEMPAYIF